MAPQVDRPGGGIALPLRDDPYADGVPPAGGGADGVQLRYTEGDAGQPYQGGEPMPSVTHDDGQHELCQPCHQTHADGGEMTQKGDDGSEPSLALGGWGGAKSCDLPAERMLHLFAGSPRLGVFTDAAEGVAAHVDAVDILLGGRDNDLLSSERQDAIVASVAAAEYTVVWIGTPCSSYSIWWLAASMTTLRDRMHPEGVPGLSPADRAYVDTHNQLAAFSARVARAAYEAGCTVVIENPPDRGMRASPHFRWSARKHAPLWLLPCMRELAADVQPSWVTFPQCAAGSPFQKWTTLMAAGPRAHELRPLGTLTCTHAKHAKVARGRDSDGNSNARLSGEYPLGMVAFVVWALLRPAAWRRPGLDVPIEHLMAEAQVEMAPVLDRQKASNTAAAQAFYERFGVQRSPVLTDAQDGAAALATAVAWRSAPQAMPPQWDERCDVSGERWQQRRAEALRFISRRRAEPESPEALARRAMPTPHATPPTGCMQRVEWRGMPAGAPPRPIHVSQLYHPGVYADIQAHIYAISSGVAQAESEADEGSPRCIAKVATRVWPAATAQPEWARLCLWDCADPNDCVPLQSYDDADPVRHTVSARFFREWGERLDWPDRDMIRQVTVTGVEGRSLCDWDTVIAGHHGGLRNRYAPARKSVAGDVQRGWITSGRPHLWTVPARCVPKNIVVQDKWKLHADATLVKAIKYRVSTDDSISEEGTTSRNDGMDREHWSDAPLPKVQSLAEAVAIMRAVAADMGMVASRVVLERIALWALDLSDAFRELEVQRSERWQQQFVWWDGVRMDVRCVFGSAHMVGFFQRVSTFVLAVAARRIRQYDEQHPYGAARQAWAAWRAQHVSGGGSEDARFSMIYLDDGSAATVLGEGEPLRGSPDSKQRPVTTAVTVDPNGRVRLSLFGDKSRGQVHLAIACDTFREAGWRVAADKVQYGLSLDLLGIGITTVGDGALFVPEVKRRGMLLDIAEQQQPTSADGKIERAEVERLVGRTSHIGQVAAEANAYMQPLYRLQNAKVNQQRRGPTGTRSLIRKRPRRIAVLGNTAAQRAYQRSLAWLKAALESGVSVPLAPRANFPQVTDPRCGFLFTDAAREDGTGHGAFSVVQWAGAAQAEFLYLEQRWSPDILRALQANELSMPAGEAYGAVVMADALLTALVDATHLVIFTDSEATEAAINTGNSPSPQMDLLVRWLVERWPQVQFLGVWQKGVRNDVADGISRQRLREVLRDASAAGLSLRRLPLGDGVDALLVDAWRAPQAHSVDMTES